MKVVIDANVIILAALGSQTYYTKPLYLQGFKKKVGTVFFCPLAFNARQKVKTYWP